MAVQEETVTISGIAKDAAAFEKTVLIAGNVEGVAKVEAAALGAAGDSSFVLIKAGDTLWGIAERELGRGARYTEIFAANREVIEDAEGMTDFSRADRSDWSANPGGLLLHQQLLHRAGVAGLAKEIALGEMTAQIAEQP